MPSKSVTRYIEIKQQISELEQELESLKEAVFTDVDRQGGEIDDEDYVIRSYKQPRYKFSEKYEKKNSELKKLRKSEIDQGIATVDGYSEFVKLNFKKAAESEE